MIQTSKRWILFWFHDETLMFPVTGIGSFCSQIRTVVWCVVSVTMHTDWCYFRSREQVCLGRVTNFCLDGVLATPGSDKDVVPSALSQRLSGLKMTVCLCSPVPACPILQWLRLKRGVGGILWVLGICGVKKVGWGCYTGVKWYVEGAVETVGGGFDWDGGDGCSWKEWGVEEGDHIFGKMR